MDVNRRPQIMPAIFLLLLTATAAFTQYRELKRTNPLSTQYHQLKHINYETDYSFDVSCSHCITFLLLLKQCEREKNIFSVNVGYILYRGLVFTRPLY